MKRWLKITLATVAALALAWVFLGERLSAGQGAGALLALAGVVMVRR